MTSRSRFARGRRLEGLTPEFIELKREAFRIGVISDTHGQLHPQARKRLETQAYDLVLHAGDIGNEACLELLHHLTGPSAVVRGNIDAATVAYPEARLLVLQHQGHERLRILLIHIALTGPRLLPDVAELALEHRCDLVVCGHSHLPWWGLSQGRHTRPIPVFNPGSVGPRRFGLPIAMGEVALDAQGRLSAFHWDCDTASLWLPPKRPGA